MTTIQNVHKSRFGFHACDYPTFLKIKKLHKLYWQAVRRHAEWVRWDRKLPKNRLLKKWYRNEKGQKTGFEIIGPKPEPKRYPIFGALNYIPQGEPSLSSMGVINDYLIARHPYATPEEVKPLCLSIEKIDNMLSCLENFES